MTLPITGIGPGAASAVGAAAPVAPVTGLSKKEAEGFERLLLAQLSKSLVDGAIGEEGSAKAGPYADRLPEALTQALMDNGGIGLAKTLEGRS